MGRAGLRKPARACAITPVNGETSNTARVAYIRNIRRIAVRVAAAIILGAGVLFYLFGLKLHPHRIGLGALIAGIYVVAFGVGGSFVYRSQMAVAKRL
jgi:hypothetical protein